MATQPSMLSLEPHKSVPAPFLTKTYHLVDDPSTDHIVSWSDDNSTFVVWRPPEFARDLLPNYFKHNNFSSFVRQLNTYGFRKIVPERWEFANEFFRKGEKHLLCEIHRRKTSSPSSSSPPSHHPLHLPFPNYYSSTTPGGAAFFTSDDQLQVLPSWCDSSPSPRYMPGGVGDCYNAVPVTCTSPSASASMLMEDNERLRKSNTMLLSELAHMRKLYHDIIYFVQNYVKPVAPSSSSYPSLLPATGGNGVDVGGGVLQRLPPNGFNHHRRNGAVGTCPNSGSPTSSSSLTIVEETPLYKKTNDNSNHNNSSSSSSSGDEGQCPPKSRAGTRVPPTKLFGVPLAPSAVSKKRPLSLCTEEEEEEDRLTSSPHIPTSTKPGSVLSKEDLGLNLMSRP